MIDAATLGQSAAGFGVLFGGAYAGWQSRRARTEAKRAADNAHPVSNGWGTQVSADLSYLRAGMDLLTRKQVEADRALARHLADHAHNDTREAIPR